MFPTHLVGIGVLVVGIFGATAWSGPLSRVSSDTIPEVENGMRVEFEGDLAGLRKALKAQIDSCKKADLDERWNLGDRSVTRRQYCVKSLSRMYNLANLSGSVEELGTKFKRQFTWYKSKGDVRPERLPLLDPKVPFARSEKSQLGVLYTGYHSPHFVGSLTKTSRFKYGVYKSPSSNSLRKRYTSAQVRAGKLSGRGLELAWLESPLDAYLLGIQGSGYVDYKVGDQTKSLALKFAGSNEKNTKMMATVLRERGISEEYTTIPGLRAYYAKNPGQLLPDLNQSESVIFYSIGSPTGASGTEVTAGHSVAVDKKLFRLGSLVTVATTRPVPKEKLISFGLMKLMALLDFTDLFPNWRPYLRIAIAQDVGSAINGAGHVDFYWGEDEYSNYAAGMMRQDGLLFFAIADGDGDDRRLY